VRMYVPVYTAKQVQSLHFLQILEQQKKKGNEKIKINRLTF